MSIFCDLVNLFPLPFSGKSSAPQSRPIRGVILDEEGRGPTQRALAQEREKLGETKDVKELPMAYERHPDVRLSFMLAYLIDHIFIRHCIAKA